MRQRTVLWVAAHPREVQRTRRIFEESGLYLAPFDIDSHRSPR